MLLQLQDVMDELLLCTGAWGSCGHPPLGNTRAPAAHPSAAHLLQQREVTGAQGLSAFSALRLTISKANKQ